MGRQEGKRSRLPSGARLVGASSSSLWLRLSVSVAVALAFADASIVVLALPQIVDRLHTSISHVIWVIAAYNLALIAGALAIIPMARRLTSRPALIAGLAVFGFASLGSGAANALGVLVALRCVQGVGGALLLCASLSLFASAARPDESPLGGWAAAAAIGAAIGPAAGGLLTEVFDWRAIFLAQGPVAAAAALAVMAAHARSPERGEDVVSLSPGAGAEGLRARLDPATANIALTFLSAGLIGALFLVTILLINVWGLTPLGAAAILSAIPVATVLTERTTRGRSPVALGATGTVALAAGLTVLAVVSHRQLGWAVVALGLCGTGLGMAFPAFTLYALRSSGKPAARAARTVAARDAGIVVGLVILTPVFVHELNAASNRAVSQVAAAVLTAQIPDDLKAQLAAGLLAANANAPQSRLPDIGPPFARVEAQASAPTRGKLVGLKTEVQSLIEHAATHSFRRPLLYCALLTLLVIPLLAFRLRGSVSGASPLREVVDGG
jgi:predicted MFS family arabinose efflux permease